MKIKELKRRVSRLKDTDNFMVETDGSFNWLVIRGKKVIKRWKTKPGTYPDCK